MFRVTQNKTGFTSIECFTNKIGRTKLRGKDFDHCEKSMNNILLFITLPTIWSQDSIFYQSSLGDVIFEVDGCVEQYIRFFCLNGI